jgi:hypothetical protein
MKEPTAHLIHDPCFLRLLIALNRWEGSDQNDFQTVSSRELFYLIAESLLDKGQTLKYQTLKFLNGRLTERAMRQRVREFEVLGLITTSSNPADIRSKKLMASNKFIALLNKNVTLQRQICEQHMHLIDRTLQP